MNTIIQYLKYVNNEILRSKVRQDTCNICKFYKPKSGVCMYDSQRECHTTVLDSCPRI